MKFPIDKSLITIDETNNSLITITSEATMLLARVHQMLDHQLPPDTKIDEKTGAMIVPPPYAVIDVFTTLTDLDLISQI